MSSAAALAIEQRALDKIVPYARNPRVIPPAAIAKVAASLKEFGWRQPIVVDSDGVIVAGHVRLAAAQALGLESAPVHVADNLTPAQAKAYRLLDNRAGEGVSWDRTCSGSRSRTSAPSRSTSRRPGSSRTSSTS